MEQLPSNFGYGYSFTDFSQQGSAPGPGQIWDTQRPSKSYHGSNPGALYVTGGSLRESGKGPFSEYKQDCSNDAFWNHAAGISPQPPYSFGPGQQTGGI